MTDSTPQEFTLPHGFDWQFWVDRWDRMQEYQIFQRRERFELMAELVRTAQPSPTRILDLGCGPGSLTLEFLQSFPQTEVIGIDFDPTLLALAQARLSRFGSRSKCILANLRNPSWVNLVPAPVDAIVSATALHWLDENSLARLYLQLGKLLNPGGIFLNADHVASDYGPLQAAWERERTAWQAQHSGADDWHAFWTAFSAALGADTDEIHRQHETRAEKGPEWGMSLAWHFHALKAGGLGIVDCFWRAAGDAIYGGIRT